MNKGPITVKAVLENRAGEFLFPCTNTCYKAIILSSWCDNWHKENTNRIEYKDSRNRPCIHSCAEVVVTCSVEKGIFPVSFFPSNYVILTVEKSILDGL